MHRLLIAAAAIFAACASPVSAAAILAPDSPITFTKGTSGQQFTVDYTGYINETLATGLSAFGHFRFLGSADGLSWGFEIVELKNTSSSPILNSRLSVYGFDTDPDAADVTATGLFSYVREDQTVPGLGTREVCIKAATAKSCAGGGGIGLGQGQSVMDGGFNIVLTQASNTLTLDNFFVRFQSVNRGNQTGLSGVGTGIVTPIPEPAQWAMMIAGFAIVGGAMRSRHRRGLVPA